MAKRGLIVKTAGSRVIKRGELRGLYGNGSRTVGFDFSLEDGKGGFKGRGVVTVGRNCRVDPGNLTKIYRSKGGNDNDIPVLFGNGFQELETAWICQTENDRVV